MRSPAYHRPRTSLRTTFRTPRPPRFTSLALAPRPAAWVVVAVAALIAVVMLLQGNLLVAAISGGLAAIEAFLQNVSIDSGAAYIVVQHLDPTQKAVLVQLLQKVTQLQVQEVTSSMVIEPNHVYVIPPNKELSIAEGRLMLRPPSEPRGLRLPINVLFSSMAQSLGSQAIGVVLSGMGSDGTQGLRAIQAAEDSHWCKSPHQRNSTPCRPVPLLRNASTSWPNRKRCHHASH